MGVATADELLLAALHSGATGGQADGSGGSGEPAASSGPHVESSLAAVIDRVGGQDTRLHHQVKLAAAIDGLVEDGLVDRETDDRGQTVLRLTADGQSRAHEIYERLATTSIELVGADGRRELRLDEAADELDRSLVAVATDCSDERVYYRADTVDDDGPVGRETERDHWQAVLDRVREQRSGECVLLCGPGGVGKTALADDLLATARDQGIDVVSTRIGDESEAYGPIRDLLHQRSLNRDPFATDQSAVLDGDSYNAHQRAFHRDILDGLSPEETEQPRILYLDDLHLADAATMEFLNTLLDSLQDSPLVVLASFRPTELNNDSLIDSAAENERISRLQLDTLDRDGTRAVIERTLDRRGAPPEFIAAIHERTDGNPLFVEASVRALVETGQLDPSYEWYPNDPDEIDLPEAVHETIAKRISNLDKGPRSVLEWAAVVGESVPVNVLEQIHDSDQARLYTALTGLVEAGLFNWNDDRYSVTFKSEVVREAILEGMDPATERRRHEAVADALVHLASHGVTESGSDGKRLDADTEESPSEHTEHATTIAAHYEEALRTESAIDWYWRAIDAAMDVYAHEVALDCSHQILKLARSSGDDQTILEIGEQIARIHTTVGNYDQADRYVRFVRERLAEDDDHRQATVAQLAGEIADARGDYNTAIEETATGLERCPEDSRLRCQLLAAKARAEHWQTDYEQGVETAEELVDLAERFDAPRFRAKGLRWLGTIERRRGSFEEAAEVLKTGLTIATANDETDEEGSLALELGTATRQLGNMDRAQERYEQARQAFEAVGNRHELAKVQSNLGNMALIRHNYDEAKTYYRMAVREFGAVGDRHHEAMTQNDLATVAYEQGEYDEAYECSAEALSVHKKRTDNLHAGMAQRNLGRVARERGAYDRARDRLQAAIDSFEAADCGHYSDIPRLELARLERWVGNEKEVNRLLETVRERATDGEDPAGIESHYHCERAALAWNRGEHTTAADRFEAAFEQLSPADHPLKHALACLYRGRFHGDCGRYDAAEADCRDALKTFESMGKPHPAARARASLGHVAIDRGSTTMGLDHLETALETFQDLGAFRDTIETYATLVTTHWDQNNRHEARSCARKARSFLHEHELGDERITIITDEQSDRIQLDEIESYIEPSHHIDTEDPRLRALAPLGSDTVS